MEAVEILSYFHTIYKNLPPWEDGRIRLVMTQWMVHDESGTAVSHVCCVLRWILTITNQELARMVDIFLPRGTCLSPLWLCELQSSRERNSQQPEFLLCQQSPYCVLSGVCLLTNSEDYFWSIKKYRQSDAVFGNHHQWRLVDDICPMFPLSLCTHSFLLSNTSCMSQQYVLDTWQA